MSRTEDLISTLTRDLSPVKPLPPLRRVVAGTDVPVVPCHISGAYEAWPPDAKRPRGGRITVRVGEAHRFADVADDRQGWERVVSALRDAIVALRPVPAL